MRRNLKSIPLIQVLIYTEEAMDLVTLGGH